MREYRNWFCLSKKFAVYGQTIFRFNKKSVMLKTELFFISDNFISIFKIMFIDCYSKTVNTANNYTELLIKQIFQIFHWKRCSHSNSCMSLPWNTLYITKFYLAAYSVIDLSNSGYKSDNLPNRWRFGTFKNNTASLRAINTSRFFTGPKPHESRKTSLIFWKRNLSSLRDDRPFRIEMFNMVLLRDWYNIHF